MSVITLTATLMETVPARFTDKIPGKIKASFFSATGAGAATVASADFLRRCIWFANPPGS